MQCIARFFDWLSFCSWLACALCPTAEAEADANAQAMSNPSFSYSFTIGGSAHLCQATLVAQARGICIAATAAHCLQPALTARKTLIASLGAIHDEVVINSRALSSFQAAVYIDKLYFQEFSSWATAQDVGAFAWFCKSTNAIPVVPLGTAPFRDGASVWYGTVMNSNGLYSGVTFQGSGFSDRSGNTLGAMHALVQEDRFHLVEHGDSGGGLFLADENQKLKLVGILTLYYPPQTITAYNVGEALNFVSRVKAYLGVPDPPEIFLLPKPLPPPTPPEEKPCAPRKSDPARDALYAKYLEHFFAKEARPGIQLLDQSIALPDQDKSDVVFSLCLRAEAKIRNGYIPEGLRDLLAARALIRDNAMVFSVMSTYFLHNGDADLALIWSNKALKILPEDRFAPEVKEAAHGFVLLRKAFPLLSLGRYAEAAEAVRASRKLFKVSVQSNPAFAKLLQKGYALD